MSYFAQSARQCAIKPNLSSPSPFRYNPNKLTKPQYGHAPFGSTSILDRSITKKVSQKLSGILIQPYQQYQAIIKQLQTMAPKQSKPQSTFISKTQRFINEKMKTPGPNQYTLQSRTKVNINRNRKKNSNSVAHFKVPSIPSDHLGYKEDATNTMVKVLPDTKLQPHPGSYDIATDLANAKALKWNQNQKLNKQWNFTPGPGTYQNQKLYADKAPISSFKSNSNRFNQFAKKKGVQPGPGDYNPSLIKKKSHSKDNEGNFNSKTARFTSDKASIQLNANKSYYNQIKERVKSKSVSTLRNKLNISSKPQSIGVKKSIFDQTNKNPGPGKYSSGQGMTLKLQKQLLRKYNQTTLPQQKREIFQTQNNFTTPGPGRYQGLNNQTLKKKLSSSLYKKTQIVNLKNPLQEETPSPFDYGNFNHTISDKLRQFQNRITLVQNKPFGKGQERFQHYNHKLSHQQSHTIQAQNQEAQHQDLVYGNSNKKVKKLVMTTIKVKVPFGSSSHKMKQAKISQSPGKFYQKEDIWVKKSHNIRSKLD